MKVKDCMCGDVCYCTPENSVCDCTKIMSENHVGCIPVCNCNNEVVGLLTDRDIILRCVACGKDAKTTPVSDIMTCNVCCCNPNEELDKAEKAMSEHQIRRIPVVDENKKIIGILTLGDLAKNPKVSNEHVAYTSECICNCSGNVKNAQ